jgi:hypothetical protein
VLSPASAVLPDPATLHNLTVYENLLVAATFGRNMEDVMQDNVR